MTCTSAGSTGNLHIFAFLVTSGSWWVRHCYRPKVFHTTKQSHDMISCIIGKRNESYNLYNKMSRSNSTIHVVHAKYLKCWAVSQLYLFFQLSYVSLQLKQYFIQNEPHKIMAYFTWNARPMCFHFCPDGPWLYNCCLFKTYTCAAMCGSMSPGSW